MQEISNVRYLAKRVVGLKPSGIRKFFDIAATMKDVISLASGNQISSPRSRSWRLASVRCEREKPITPLIPESLKFVRRW